MKFVVIANSLAGLARTKSFTDVNNYVVADIKTDKLRGFFKTSGWQ